MTDRYYSSATRIYDTIPMSSLCVVPGKGKKVQLTLTQQMTIKNLQAAWILLQDKTTHDFYLFQRTVSEKVLNRPTTKLVTLGLIVKAGLTRQNDIIYILK